MRRAGAAGRAGGRADGGRPRPRRWGRRARPGPRGLGGQERRGASGAPSYTCPRCAAEGRGAGRGCGSAAAAARRPPTPGTRRRDEVWSDRSGRPGELTPARGRGGRAAPRGRVGSRAHKGRGTAPLSRSLSRPAPPRWLPASSQSAAAASPAASAACAALVLSDSFVCPPSFSLFRTSLTAPTPSQPPSPPARGRPPHGGDTAIWSGITGRSFVSCSPWCLGSGEIMVLNC